MESDFIRSATAIVAGEVAVAGVTDSDSGLDETRVVANFESSRAWKPYTGDGTSPNSTTYNPG